MQQEELTKLGTVTGFGLKDVLLEHVTIGERTIIRLLRDYPNINLSMIGIMCRPTMGPVWKNILQELVKEGVVLQYNKERPNGNLYTVYCLSNEKFIIWDGDEE